VGVRGGPGRRRRREEEEEEEEEAAARSERRPWRPRKRRLPPPHHRCQRLPWAVAAADRVVLVLVLVLVLVSAARGGADWQTHSVGAARALPTCRRIFATKCSSSSSSNNNNSPLHRQIPREMRGRFAIHTNGAASVFFQ
jgi:hypothetical protein